MSIGIYYKGNNCNLYYFCIFYVFAKVLSKTQKLVLLVDLPIPIVD